MQKEFLFLKIPEKQINKMLDFWACINYNLCVLESEVKTWAQEQEGLKQIIQLISEQV